MKQSHKTLLLWVLLILMFVAIYNLVSDPDQPQSVAFSDFMTDVRNGKVEQVTIRPRENSAEYRYIAVTDEGPQEEGVGRHHRRADQPRADGQQRQGRIHRRRSERPVDEHARHVAARWCSCS